MGLEIVNEEDVLRHVTNFRKNFNALHPSCAPLLYTARNEKDQKKPIMSFITPTLIPCLNFLNLEEAVATLSRLIKILPLQLNELPKKVSSPFQVMEIQQATVIEAAILAASVLIGSGYKVLIAQGKAVHDKVMNDFTKKFCPYQPPETKFEVSTEKKITNKYNVISIRKLQSKFEAQRKESDELKEKAEELEEKRRIITEIEEACESDATCIYYWVIILPREERGVKTTCFANISDGVLYEATDCDSVFKELHSVFDTRNFWACRHFNYKLSALNFDLNDSHVWLALIENSEDNPVVMSMRWTQPLIVSEKMIQLKYPNGTRREEYKDARVDKWAPFVQPEGLVMSVVRKKVEKISYKENEWKTFELFAQREDCLCKRTTTFNEEMYECFSRFRKDTLKAHRYKRKPIFSINLEEVTETSEGAAQNGDANLVDQFSGEMLEFYDEFRADAVKSRYIYLVKADSIINDMEDVFTKDLGPTRRRWRASMSMVGKNDPDLLIFNAEDDEDGISPLTIEAEPFLRETPEVAEGELVKITPKIALEKSAMTLSDFMQKLEQEHAKRKKAKTTTSEGKRIVMKETFGHRQDLLQTRTVTFVSMEVFLKEKKLTTDCIQEIEEEIRCLPAAEEPAKFIQRRTFSSVKHQCLLAYHYGQNCLLQGSHLFDVPKDNNPSSLTPEMVKSFEPDTKTKLPSIEELRGLLGQQLQDKDRIEQEVLKSVEEMREITQRREEEQTNIVLTSDLFQFDHNHLLKKLMEADKEKEARQEENEKKRREEREGKVDNIAPYLPLLLTEPDSVSRKQQIKEKCLDDLMVRLELRANLLQDRLETTKNEVIELRNDLNIRRRRLTPEERASLAERATKAETQHRRIRGFLATWRNEAAHRYEALESALESDPRLNSSSQP